MKKVLVLLLLMVSTSVFAEWTKIGENGSLNAYVDFGSIRKSGNKIEMLKLGDFKAVQQTKDNRYLSTVSIDEYDCEEKKSRLLNFYWYSGNMGEGEVVYSQSNIKEEYHSIITDTFAEIFFKAACRKK